MLLACCSFLSWPQQLSQLWTRPAVRVFKACPHRPGTYAELFACKWPLGYEICTDHKCRGSSCLSPSQSSRLSFGAEPSLRLLIKCPREGRRWQPKTPWPRPAFTASTWAGHWAGFYWPTARGEDNIRKVKRIPLAKGALPEVDFVCLSALRNFYLFRSDTKGNAERVRAKMAK